MDQPDYLPISMLNQVTYCERRFWLMYVHGEMVINAPVLEGIQQHGRVHCGGVERDGRVTIRRRVYVWSDRLRVAGFADLVEEREGELVPVEHKHGRRGHWLSDQVQLCAQGLCLEERTGRRIERGEIFYWRSRRRERVVFDAALRARTEATVARAFELLAENRIPAPLDKRAKCRDCSVEMICLPREVLLLSKEQA
jgi:CRISPR-associated exonuclease Cas4